ncbi:MAG: alpha/beta hydrolase [Trueperaceae bacterium]|nr:MAG: alpha/beta hydrolase [Trueperaceae bacterium]
MTIPNRYPRETEYLKRPNGTLAFDDSGGSGEPVIMIPGIGDLRSEYRFLAPELQRAGYRVITLDLRGHGESSAVWPEYNVEAVAGDILALIDHLQAEPATVIGTSFAPAAALWAAAEAPDKIRRLVLISSHLEAAGQTFSEKAQNALLKLLISSPWKARLWETFYASWYPSEKPQDFDDYLAKLRANIREPGRFEAIKTLLFADRDGLAERLAKVNTPALIVMGTRDNHFKDPAVEAERIAAKISGQVRLIDGAGHYPHAEMPSQTAPAVLDFLAHGAN